VPADGVEIGVRKESPIGENGVQRLDRVPLALYVPVTPRVGARLGRDAQDPVVQHTQNIETREAATRVAGPGIDNQAQHASTQPHGFQSKFPITHRALNVGPARPVFSRSAPEKLLVS
jgi:hypothetical protein